MLFNLLFLFITLSNISINVVHGISKHPIAVVLAYDAFRHDYFEKGVTPVLEGLSKKGTHADYMNNVFITKTYPNFHSISTGTYPETHGVTGNSFYEPLLNKSIYYSANMYNYNPDLIPIWIANEMEGNGRHSGSMMWPGGEYTYQGYNSTYSVPWLDTVPWEDRINSVIQWLVDPVKPANLVLIYIEEPDAYTHGRGPESEFALDELRKMDKITQYLLDRLNERNLTDIVNLFFLADHGMQSVNPKDILDLRPYVADNLYIWNEDSPNMLIDPKEGYFDTVYNGLKKAEAELGHFHVYKREDIPEKWHYKYSRRISPIIAIADIPYAFHDFYSSMEHYQDKYNFTVDETSRFGVHGYDNDAEIMKPFFFAVGPNIKTGHRVEPFDNIDLYPLWCHLLGIPQYSVDINGTYDHVSDILVAKSSKLTSFVLPSE